MPLQSSLRAILPVPLLLSALSLSLPAEARLGEERSMLQVGKSADGKVILAPHTLRVTQKGYTVSTSTLPSGTEVTEYADQSGKVFAVSWKGPTKPDLQELLGPHFQAIKDAAEKTLPTGRSQLMVETSDVVIRASGHMRAHRGQAWLPKALPADFQPEDLQ